MCAYAERYSPSFSEGNIDRTGAQTMLYLTCTTITSVDLAHYGVSRAKGWVSVDCGTKHNCIGVGRLRVLGGARFRIFGGPRGGGIPSRHMTS